MSTQMKTVKIPQLVIDTLTCDNCGKEVQIDDSNDDDIYEAQEFLHIKHSCGYSSIFGDCNTVECDLCQDCVKLLLGNVIKIKENNN